MARKSLIIRDQKIYPPLFLAPMAGVTHSAFRSILALLGGVGMFSTEMLSARRLPVENPVISPYLITTAKERPLSYQLLVTSVAEVEGAIDAVHRFGADAIDLNLGCPAPAVRKAGGGSSLAENSKMVRDIVRAARTRTNLPLTAKIRLGKRLDKQELISFCRMLEGEGLDLLTIHARLQKEKFCRPPRWEWIGYVKNELTIPVVANGAIFSVEDARKCLQVSGADGLMVGRAAPQTPWIFAEIAREVYGVEPKAVSLSLPEIYMLLARELTERFRPERRLGRLKEFTHYFAENYLYGHHLASGVQTSNTMDEALQRAAAFFERNASTTGLQKFYESNGQGNMISAPTG